MKPILAIAVPLALLYRMHITVALGSLSLSMPGLAWFFAGTAGAAAVLLVLVIRKMAADGPGVVPRGELRDEKKKMPNVLRVLVGPQHAGAIERTADGWTAQAHGLRPTPETAHATAGEALRAVLRSSWARRLGARKRSSVHWSAKARALAARSPRSGEARP